MIKLHKNDIYRIIKEVHKLDPNNFILTDYNDEDFPISKLTIRNSEMNFIFKNVLNKWERFHIKYNLFTPNCKSTDWIPNPKVSSSFKYEEVITHFNIWINNHAKPYLEEQGYIDLWNNFQFETSIFELTQIRLGDNSKFNTDESSKISNSIENLKQLILDNYETNRLQQEYIIERLDYLSDATNRLGKFDWANMLVSVMISIAINMNFDTESGRKFFDLIKEAFNNVRFLLSN